VRTNSLEIAKALVDAGADFETRTHQQNTALHLAISKGTLDVASYLIDIGADLEA